MNIVIHYCDDNTFVPEVVECSSFTIDRTGNYEPLIRFFDSEENLLKSVSLTICDFHVCGKEK